MNSKPYFQIRPDGTVNVLPAPPKTVSVDHAKRPVNFAVRRAPLGLEIHGENFSTVIDLTVDDALSIIMLLTYAAREAVYAPTKSQFPEVAQ